MDFLHSKDTVNSWAAEFAAGNQRAAEKLFNYLYPLTYRYIRSRLKQKDAADDVAQEVFLKLARSIRLYDIAGGNFTAWFWQIVKNTLTDHFRSVSRRPEYVSAEVETDIEMVDEITHTSDSTSESETSLDMKRVNEIVSSFSEEDQELFRLKYVADLSYQEIEKITERTEQALRVALHRIREKIKKQL